jgi:hypothetical protein
MITMDATRTVNAQFDFFLPLTPPGAGPTRSAIPSLGAWTSYLEVPRGRGQVSVNGAMLATGPGVTRGSLPLRAGENRVEAWLTDGSGAGVWRFELGDLVEPGTLTVGLGQVLVVTGDTVVFRLSGRAGERVAFTFQSRGEAGSSK